MTYDWYIRTYICLMETRRYRGSSVQDRKRLSESTGEYFEIHHILPKALGGVDTPNNRVILTFREHVIAHKLLVVIHKNDPRMIKALTWMITCTVDENGTKVKKELSSREASDVRKLYSKSVTGPLNPNFGKFGKDAPHFGHKQPESAKKTIGDKNRGRLVGEKNPMYGVRLTGEKNPMYGKFGRNHPASKRIIDPNGNIFECAQECADYYGVLAHTVRYWINKHPEKGFKYIEK